MVQAFTVFNRFGAGINYFGETSAGKSREIHPIERKKLGVLRIHIF